MICPHCQKALPSIECDHCQARIPEDSAYCAYCGNPAPVPLEEEQEEQEGDPFADRVLCSDGACIGVIGPDGRCKECGKPSQPEPEEA